MSKPRLMRLIRRQDYYRPMLRALAEFGVSEFEIIPPSGRGHPILAFHNGHHDVRFPLPTTVSSGRAKRYVPTEIKRILRDGQRTVEDRRASR